MPQWLLLPTGIPIRKALQGSINLPRKERARGITNWDYLSNSHIHALASVRDFTETGSWRRMEEARSPMGNEHEGGEFT